MTNTFKNKNGRPILLAMVKGIQDNKGYLGDVDGLIGDGDHGMNMNKGFTLFAKRFGDHEFSFSDGLENLSMILLNEIGGSMGPIYGTILMEMADALSSGGSEEIGLSDFTAALSAGLEGLYGIVDARVGDKTLVDTLAPAVASLQADIASGSSFDQALVTMKTAAEAGKESTKNLVAKYGRSSRLGERSRGVLDAGACSCNIILQTMADGILCLLNA
ncbi:MAG: dihydroxyacetone kinase subunit DhaL [Lawsonibacter sp.]|nr:dihydroxyacetone kinase subunit DhaL [Lawsonibacter sp.]